jgi:Tfp pilus assembly protein PilX
MTWFVVFAGTVFGLYFWRDYRVQQREMQSASSPLRTGERYIGQVMTVPTVSPTALAASSSARVTGRSAGPTCRRGARSG